MEILKRTNDYVFKKIFGQKKNTEILKDLIVAILPNIKIKTIAIRKDVALEKKLIQNKLGILDITATLNDNTVINIEMQVSNEFNIVERSLFYWAGLYHDGLMVGENYLDNPRTICICILDYSEFKEGPFHEIATIRRKFENIQLTDKLELHYIQLPKFRKKCKVISSKLDEWLTFISSNDLEEIKMIDNKYVKQAQEELEYLSGDEEERRYAELREKAIRDEAAAIKGATDRGIAIGRTEGKAEANIETAKKMLRKGLDIELIMEITGMSKKEIEEIS